VEGEARMKKGFVMRLAQPLVIALVAAAVVVAGAAFFIDSPDDLQFVVTSDAHYGLTRPKFRGHLNVDAHTVNAALVSQINTLPETHFPLDGGLNAGRAIGGVDFVVEAGDITNREEHTDQLSIQPASVSWSQFVDDYINGVRLRDHSGHMAPVFVVPGNHEASNAVGFYKTMSPPTDVGPLVEIYNRMLKPAHPETEAAFDYGRDRVFYTRDLGGVHFVFLHVWPDSAMRDRMEQDFAQVRSATPIVIVTHDQPDVEAKHFINPNGSHDINAGDQFENLLADQFEDGAAVDTPSLIEQIELEKFLARHPNVVAYFHGNSNWHQVYEWNGPGHSARLHTVRVDSPMKGAVSSIDETRLSFEMVTIDSVTRTMTVRECLWNADPSHPDGPVKWGDSVTLTMAAVPSGT
jgi:calcineurin-like phosphoesterase family protein